MQINSCCRDVSGNNSTFSNEKKHGYCPIFYIDSIPLNAFLKERESSNAALSSMRIRFFITPDTLSMLTTTERFIFWNLFFGNFAWNIFKLLRKYFLKPFSKYTHTWFPTFLKYRTLSKTMRMDSSFRVPMMKTDFGFCSSRL